MKKYHKLARKQKFLKPERFLFFDTETHYKQEGEFIVHNFWFGYMIYRDKERRIEKPLFDKSDFWSFIDHAFTFSEEDLFCIAHNAFFRLYDCGRIPSCTGARLDTRTCPCN